MHPFRIRKQEVRKSFYSLNSWFLFEKGTSKIYFEQIDVEEIYVEQTSEKKKWLSIVALERVKF